MIYKQEVELPPDFVCTVEGQAADGADEAVGEVLFAGQEVGRPHDLRQSLQVLSSAPPHSCITVPEEQRTRGTKSPREPEEPEEERTRGTKSAREREEPEEQRTRGTRHVHR